ncbi:MAG: hypothetical protein R3B98_01720 [Hyphomonas sp.]
MRRQFFRPAGLALAGLCLLPMLGACQTGPRIRAAKAPGANEPIAVVAAVIPEEGPKTNQWGGIIPDAKPSTPVDDGGLGEIGN